MLERARRIIRRMHVLDMRDWDGNTDQRHGTLSHRRERLSNGLIGYYRHLVREHLETRLEVQQNGTEAKQSKGFRASDIPLICSELHHLTQSSELTHSQLRFLVDSESDKFLRRMATQEQRIKVQRYIESLRQSGDPQWDSIPRICDDLQSKLDDLPRKVLYNLAWDELFKLQRSQVTEEHREAIRQHMHQLAPPFNASEISAELCPNINLPQHVVHELVLHEKMRRSRAVLTAAQRKELGKLVFERLQANVSPLTDGDEGSFTSRPASGMTSELADLFHTQFHEIPKRMLYNLIQQDVNKYYRKRVSKEQRAQVQTLVAQQKQSIQAVDRSQLDNFAQNIQQQLKLDFPTSVITEIVHGELRKMQKKSTSSLHLRQLRKKIRAIAQRLTGADVSRIHDALSKESKLLPPKRMMQQLIREELQKLANQSISKEQRQFVRNFVEQHVEMHNDIPRLCDAIQTAEMPPLPRNVLYQLVFQFLRTLRANQNTPNKDQIQALREWISPRVAEHFSEQSGEVNIDNLIPQVEEYLQHQGLHLAKHVLRRQIYSITDKMQRNSITKEQRDSIREYIESRESEIRNDIPRLCDELQERVSIPRRILLHVTREEVSKLDKRMLNEKQKELIKEHMEQQLIKADYDTPTIGSVCDELQSEVQVPRRALYAYIHQVMSYRRRQLKRQQNGDVQE